VRILGIDPGLNVTGLGLVEQNGRSISCVEYDQIVLARNLSLSVRLKTIHENLAGIIIRTRPDAVAIEDIFYGKNVQSLIKQGHARGVIILAAVQAGLAVSEYSPLEIKKAVACYGRAEKQQVQQMVRAILRLDEPPPPDAADALAVAICHLHCGKKDCL